MDLASILATLQDSNESAVSNVVLSTSLPELTVRKKMKTIQGLYVITDDILTPPHILYSKVYLALMGGASIIQLRNKIDDDEQIELLANALQYLCRRFNALFVMNDRFRLAIKNRYDGLHIGKSDYANFDYIRENFKGIIGVSCYGDLQKAKEFEQKGADYVAFGSFYPSLTKPNTTVVPLDIISRAKNELQIPVGVIGGINENNIEQIRRYQPDMVCIINALWSSKDIVGRCKFFKNYC